MMMVLSWLAWLIVSPYIAVVVHEIGHLCAAVAVRWPVEYVKFGGGREVRVLRWPIDVYVGTNPLYGCVYVSAIRLKTTPEEAMRRYRVPLAIIGGAGPLASIAAGACATLAGLHILGLVSMFYGMWTLLSSDGKIVMGCLRGDFLLPITVEDA